MPCFSPRSAAMALALTLVLSACREESPETLIASARDYLSRHEARAAVIQIKNALQKSPDLPEARFLLGRAFLEEGDAVAAELELRKALDLDYATDQVTPWLARALLAQGKPDKVLEEFSSHHPADPQSRADLYTTLALALAARGEAEAARVALIRARTAYPDHPPTILAEARLLAARRDYAAALGRLEAIPVGVPDEPEAWKLKGDILHFQGKGEAAVAAYRRALDLKPDAVPVQLALIAGLLEQSRLEEAERQVETLRKIAPKNPQALYLEAMAAFQKGDFPAARDAVREVLRLVPDNALALQLAGAVEFRQRAWSNAEDHLAKALRLVPELSLARRFLAATHLEKDEPAKALAVLQPLLDKGREDPQVLALAGQIHIRRGDIQKAEEYFSRAAALDPQDAGKRTSLAISRLMGGQVEAAREELERIAAADQGSAADLALIGSFLSRREFDRALEAIAALEKKQPGKPLAHTLRGRVEASRGRDAEARSSFEKALALDAGHFPAVAGLAGQDVAAGNGELAKKRLDAFLAANPKHVEARLALAEISRQGGASTAEVAGLLGKAIAIEPAAPGPRLMLIQHYLRSQDAGKAIAAAQEAVSRLPERPEILDALGVAQQMAGNYNQALATYGQLAALMPESPQPLVRMADIHLAARNREEALRSLRRALELRPGADLAARLHAVLEEEGAAGAEQFSRTWLREHPRDADFLAHLGDRATSRRDYEAAVRHYRAVLDIQPDNAAVLNNLAWVAGQQKHPRALEYAEKANRLAPGQPAIMDTLAMLLAEKGDSRRALDLLQKAVERAPGATEIRLHLARVLIKSGNRAAARRELEALGRLGGKFPRQDEITQLLREV